MAAVSFAGSETSSVGLRIATSGARKRLPNKKFFAFGVLTIATIETSEPVPAVVGMAIDQWSEALGQVVQSLIFQQFAAQRHAYIYDFGGIKDRTAAHGQYAITSCIARHFCALVDAADIAVWWHFGKNDILIFCETAQYGLQDTGFEKHVVGNDESFFLAPHSFTESEAVAAMCSPKFTLVGQWKTKGFIGNRSLVYKGLSHQ